MKIVTEKKEFVTVKEILAWDKNNEYMEQYGKVLAMFPLTAGDGEITGVVNIERMDFLLFNKPNLVLISLVVEWLARALDNRKLYQAAVAREIRDEKLEIYTFNYFEEVSDKEFLRAQKYALDMGVIFLKLNKYGFLDYSAQNMLNKLMVSVCKKYISGTSQLFRYKYDGTFAAVCPMAGEKDLADILRNIRKEADELANEKKQTAIFPGFTAGAAALRAGIKTVRELKNIALTECGIPTE
ncbi:MAG: hypothetical protein HQL28_02585 [Candidatus Omnitrophica bacterium]|nr:hypothetical protein [Candidatus Omnitrophota bacterium]